MSKVHNKPAAGSVIPLASSVPRPRSKSTHHPGPLPCLRLLALLVFCVTILPSAFGQATPTASRNYGIAGFFAAGKGDTDYGQNDSAFIVGADVQFYPRWARSFRPSIEGRLTFMPGQYVGQKTFGGGLIVERPFGRVHPYGAVEVGYGIITLPVLNDPYYNRDNSLFFSVGGGANIDVHGPFALKVDVQEQSWKLGNANSRLTPQLFTVGVQYTLPSRAFRSVR